MITDIEESPSDRAKCSLCEKAIPKGKLRGKEYNNHFRSFKYYCDKCALAELKTQIEIFNQMIFKLEIDIVS